MKYLTGFEGSSAWILITKERNIFITDFRYKEEAERLFSSDNKWELFIYKEGVIKTIFDLVNNLKLKQLAIESSVTYEFYSHLLRIGLKVVAISNIVEEIRSLKDQEEVRLIREAVRRAEDAFQDILPYIRPGRKEIDISLKLENALKKRGCKRLPFDIIVASGPNSSMPHAKTSSRRLSPGDLVIIDWGGEAGGYFSDMTRTLLIKGDKVSKKIEMYETVLRANKNAIKGVKPGVKAEKIDAIARGIIREKGFGDYFGHGTGHGVGLDVHEKPSVSPKSKDTLKAGMVFTIEPGIYIPGLGGVRIEDMVYVTPKGGSVITGLKKALKII